MSGLHDLPENLPVPVDDGGADHLEGLRIPSISLRSASGDLVDLSSIPGRVVVYCYPMTGRPDMDLPVRWESIPGARGCTPQTLSYVEAIDEFVVSGVPVFGLSAQDSTYQAEMVERLGVPFPVLSDADGEFRRLLALPTFTVEGTELLKRLTFVALDGVIEKVWYPVFPPDRNAATVLEWLRSRPS